MTGFIRRLPLQIKLLLIAVIPVLFIAFLTFQLYVEKTRHLTLVKSYLTRLEQSAAISRLIAQLQTERRVSFDYALHQADHKALQQQRPATDSALNVLKQVHDESLNHFTSYTFLENLDSVRELIDGNRYTTTQVMYTFSNAIFRLNTINRPPTITNESLHDVYTDMTLQRLLSELITYQGIISGNIYNILFTRQYVAETLFGTLGTYDVYRSYEKEIEIKRTPDTERLLDSLREGPLKKVDDYFQKVFTNFKLDSSYTYQSWSRLADRSLNDLQTAQLGLLKKVEDRMKSYSQKEQEARSRSIIYLIVISAVLVVLLVYVLSAINRSLGRLKNAALKIADGATGIQLPPEPNDAIGSLASSIKKVDEKNKELATAAQQIGEGNFGVHIQPRSKEDVLGNAIVQMKEKLLRYTTDLRKSREEFKQLADFTPQIVWTANAEGKVDYYNKKWYEVTGAKQGYGDQNWIPFLHPEDAGYCLTSWYHSVETGEFFQLEYRIKDPRSKSYRWYLGRALPIKDDSGRITKWFGTLTDIHDQKMQNEKLEELVAQRTVELKRSNEDLQQFAHVASHDLKEPVRKISTFSDRMAVEYGHQIPEKAKTYLHKIHASSERMAAMIDSILRYSVINANKDVEEMVDLNRLLEGIINDLELLIVQKEATINYKALPAIKGRPVLLYQLFYNLIANALKFSKENVPAVIDIRSEIKTPSELEQRADLGPAERYIQIEVRDNGIGFNQEFANKLFDVFSRLNSREKYEGTGLGLALCKKIVHRHHGIIYAKGEEGVGSAFFIVLPKRT